MALLLLAFGAVGHMVLWVSLVNRVHAFGIERRWIKLITLFCVAAWALVPIAVAATLLNQAGPKSIGARLSASPAAASYLAFCAILCLGSAIQRWLWSRHPERTAALLSNHTTHVRLPERAEPLTASGVPTWLARLPGNQILKIRTQEKELVIPRLVPAHDGLRIAHLTDLHMCGRVARAFFEHVIEEVNATAPDLIAVTGDLVEGDQFLSWIQSTLGRLRARYGVYYVLGNHDRRASEHALKSALEQAGLIHVGGTWRQITVDEAPLILAGNELPWYEPAADFSDCPGHKASAGPTRILLAHSPDQFLSAQANDVDLMMAGHLHGGQVRLPILGAITSPSHHGVRYVSGVFTAGNTVMHVSRGVGALTPLRIGCPPEVAVLVLRSTNR